MMQMMRAFVYVLSLAVAAGPWSSLAYAGSVTALSGGSSSPNPVGLARALGRQLEQLADANPGGAGPEAVMNWDALLGNLEQPPAAATDAELNRDAAWLLGALVVHQGDPGFFGGVVRGLKAVHADDEPNLGVLLAGQLTRFVQGVPEAARANLEKKAGSQLSLEGPEFEGQPNPDIRARVQASLSRVYGAFGREDHLEAWLRPAVLVAGRDAIKGPDYLAAQYLRALSDHAAFEGPEIRERFPLVRPMLNSSGKPIPAGKSGDSAPVLTSHPDGGVGVFKPFRYLPSNTEYPYKRAKILFEVAAAYILRSGGINAMPYQMARAAIEGVEYFGAITPYLPNLRSLKDDLGDVPPAELAGRLVGVDEFVRGSVYLAWMGDPDRVMHTGNVWFQEIGGGRLSPILGDFGSTMLAGVEILGVPKVPISMFQSFARPEIIRNAVAEITGFSDEHIRRLVEGGLAAASGFGASLREYISMVLIRNREALRRGDVFDSVLPGGTPHIRLAPSAADALADVVLRGERDPVRAAALAEAAAMSNIMTIYQVPSPYVPLRGLFERLTLRLLAGEQDPVALTPGEMPLLGALISLIHEEGVTIAQSVRAGLGYYP